MTRHGQTRTPTVPVVLPQVVVHSHNDDAVTITVDGEQFDSAPIQRAELGAALGRVAEQARVPIRVEIHEPNDTHYADIITPPPTPGDRPTHPVQKRRRRRQGVEVAGGGFLPGETVRVAVTVQTETADHTGQAAARLHHRAAPDGVESVLMFGTVSGTLLLAESL